MRILSIETSCDETAISLLEAKGGLKNPSFKILHHVVSSQVKLHAPFGGVVPMLAKREHAKNLPLLLKKILPDSVKNKINLISVTIGPGLEPALWEGINFAKALAKKLQKPLLGVNHLEGHIYSNWINQKSSPEFPAVCLIVSGGHTILALMKNTITWKILGETRDDAIGEAFDKVARMLNLPYPGGPAVEKQAKKGKPDSVIFPSPMINSKDYDFSFSGLKTAVLYYLRDHKNFKTENVCASFQKSAFSVLIKKTLRAAKEFKAKSVLLCGGVASSKALRSLFKKETKKAKLSFFAPALKLNTDNASMIAAAAYFNFLQKKKKTLRANGNLSI
ncbi:MAG: tRNA (adenosine(37)-N6)-threonylcarbamoyltransferase complex transferase subunit TsaD [Candidatus Liptonbacteria bacterium RIFOXYC1_FULL_36_8]|uniref:tRNA N6-adenosine threonylcarbamoyltransferase n=1 Tax=Candidatus Liptonbacteria bacterium RIFOXYC1_FULL_36_8 TaxID=1798655 RepID=A0A1G2CPS8_9BACT|nr:MAG: tRNA (adenosine(37)-N6)-threonylcarbamoyltransferase complex transferase subunit TsaD [Candidatus Liptonbacteria bacterium RIFOXYC1_FULL_36_8]